jgi:hypothetical protein
MEVYCGVFTVGVSKCRFGDRLTFTTFAVFANQFKAVSLKSKQPGRRRSRVPIENAETYCRGRLKGRLERRLRRCGARISTLRNAKIL